MKFRFSKFGILAVTAALATLQLRAEETFPDATFYCKGETVNKQYIGADGRFIRIDKATYLSWSKTQQDAYNQALQRHILRTDASAQAWRYAATYAETELLEMHRLRLDALNKDARLFPFRKGKVDLFDKSEGQMTPEENRAFVKAIDGAQLDIETGIARKRFNSEFCAKR
jgi:hypothetical protein